MSSLRTASFWIAAVVLPGGLLLLVPMAVRAARRGLHHAGLKRHWARELSRLLGSCFHNRAAPLVRRLPSQ